MEERSKEGRCVEVGLEPWNVPKRDIPEEERRLGRDDFPHVH